MVLSSIVPQNSEAQIKVLTRTPGSVSSRLRQQHIADSARAVQEQMLGQMLAKKTMPMRVEFTSKL